MASRKKCRNCGKMMHWHAYSVGRQGKQGDVMYYKCKNCGRIAAFERENTMDFSPSMREDAMKGLERLEKMSRR